MKAFLNIQGNIDIKTTNIARVRTSGKTVIPRTVIYNFACINVQKCTEM